MDGVQLVRMVNDISNFFNTEEDKEVAAAGVVGHIKRFWNPRMHKQLIEFSEQSGGEGLSDLSRAAVNKLDRTS
ncbi:MAG: formate dehydrogenase subunit delta [Burkholderiales bacterium]|nr:formate dehydrogenase subunit delta [Burkholderiales bacterium]